MLSSRLCPHAVLQSIQSIEEEEKCLNKTQSRWIQSNKLRRKNIQEKNKEKRNKEERNKEESV